MMDDICTYIIQVFGKVSEDEINLNSPYRMTLNCEDNQYTSFTVSTDQSGMVGLIRHIHGLGFVLQSVARSTKTA